MHLFILNWAQISFHRYKIILWFVCLFACLFGFFCFFDYQVDSAYANGDYEGARRNSNIAKWLNVAAILCGISLIAYLVVQFAVLAALVSP